MPNRVVLTLLAIAGTMLAGLLYLLAVREPPAATLPEIGPGAKRISGSATIGALPDGGRR